MKKIIKTLCLILPLSLSSCSKAVTEPCSLNEILSDVANCLSYKYYLEDDENIKAVSDRTYSERSGSFTYNFKSNLILSSDLVEYNNHEEAYLNDTFRKGQNYYNLRDSDAFYYDVISYDKLLPEKYTSSPIDFTTLLNYGSANWVLGDFVITNTYLVSCINNFVGSYASSFVFSKEKNGRNITYCIHTSNAYFEINLYKVKQTLYLKGYEMESSSGSDVTKKKVTFSSTKTKIKAPKYASSYEKTDNIYSIIRNN